MSRYPYTESADFVRGLTTSPTILCRADAAVATGKCAEILHLSRGDGEGLRRRRSLSGDPSDAPEDLGRPLPDRHRVMFGGNMVVLKMIEEERRRPRSSPPPVTDEDIAEQVSLSRRWEEPLKPWWVFWRK